MNEDFLKWIDQRLTESAILQNPYFKDLAAGTLSLQDFRDSQKQFYFAVRFFSRPMAALMARMPSSTLRQGLIHNLSEEHGFEDEPHLSFDTQLAHDLTFLRFLESCGVSNDEVPQLREGAPVRAFNLGLLGACMMEPIDLAFASLGIIEYAFADISALIGSAVVRHGWVSYDDLVHYKLHAEIDKRHAADFFTVVEASWSQGGESRAVVGDGIALGLHLFDRLYSELHLRNSA